MAGPACSVCIHPERDAIDHALLDGETERSIAARFGLSRGAVSRHRPHVGEALSKAREIAAIAPAPTEAAHGDTLLAHITALQGKAEGILAYAERVLSRVEEEGGDVRECCAAIQAANSSIREVRSVLELLAKAVALIPPENQTNVLINLDPRALKSLGDWMALNG